MTGLKIQTISHIQKLSLKIIFLIYCILLFPITLHASVEKDHYPGSFTCKQVDSLIQEALSYKTFDIGQYKYLSNQALTLAKKLPCKSQEALALLHVGSCYFYEEKFYNAMACYFGSNDLYTELKNFDGCIATLSMLVNCYMQINDKSRAYEYLQKMGLLLPKCLDKISYGKYNYNWSLYYYQTEKLYEAEKASYLSIYYFEKASALTEAIRALKILGDIKLHKGEFNRSIYSYQLAIDKSVQLGDNWEIAILYTRISHVYNLLHNYQEALKYNIKALKIREKQGTKELYASSLINIGGAYLKLNNYDSAKYYLEKGIAVGRPLNKSFLLEHAYKELYLFYHY